MKENGSGGGGERSKEMEIDRRKINMMSGVRKEGGEERKQRR